MSNAVQILGACIVVAFFCVGCSRDSTSEKDPIYWVAPMDANYRRDGPGQSPMGMDLVPVYEESNQSSGLGVVDISPEVQNQLGVRTTVAELGRLQRAIRSQGRVRFNQTLISKLSPRVTAWVDMLFVATEGESVKRGQPLYSLYSPELITAQEVFLKAVKLGDPAQILNAESDLRLLKVDPIAISRLKNEGVAQQSMIFRAPKDGVLGLLKVGEGDYVEPGDVLMIVGSLENVWVDLDIFESQAGLIASAQAIQFTSPSYPERVWETEVSYIYPSLNERTQSLRFRSEVENINMLLKPNMQIQASIALPQRKPAVLVPRQAVIDLGLQQRVVLSLGEGRFKSVSVIVGQSNSQEVEVVSGVEEGDVVVSSAHFLIDSESSKTSDFKRMMPMELSTAGPEYPHTWVNAVVIEVSVNERTVRLEHEAIQDWNMASMTMKFNVKAGVDMSGMSTGKAVRVQVADGEPLFRVTGIKPLTSSRQK